MPLNISDQGTAILLVHDQEFGKCFDKPSTILYAFLKYPMITHVTFYEDNERVKIDRERYIKMHSWFVFHENVVAELHVTNYSQSLFHNNMVNLLGENWKQVLRLFVDSNQYIKMAVDSEVYTEEDVQFLTEKIKQLARINA